MLGGRCAPLVGLVALFALGLLPTRVAGHIDAVRASLSQLYLQADVVALTRIDAVADRAVPDGEETVVFEVVTATVIQPFKGDPPVQLTVYPDAHGPAHYQSGDTAVLFLERPDVHHSLHRFVERGELDYISRQVRNTEHLVEDAWLADYRWVLDQYALSGDVGAAAAVAAAAEADGAATGATATVPMDRAGVEQVLMRMLDSGSPALVESALIDWQTTGVHFDKADVEHLVAITRAADKPLNLRLSILRTLAGQQLVGPAAWDPLFDRSRGQDLMAVTRSTRGFEHKHFQPRLEGFLRGTDGALVEVAARALGDPAYAGSEAALEPLLKSTDLRLNYAGVAGLVGIQSPRGRAILQREALAHPNSKVRRQIQAKLDLSK
jgi:hypothetical protein